MFEQYLSSMPRDETSMRLSHPQRVRAFMNDDLDDFAKVLGAEWPVLRQALEDPQFCLARASCLAEEKGLLLFSRFLRASARTDGATEYGGSAAFLVGLRQHTAPGPHFLVDDDLVELLQHTDLAEDVPLSMLKLPYRRMYLELGGHRDLDLTIANALSGDHILEGAYLEQADDLERGPGLYIVLTGSPLGKEHVMDDATQAVFLSTAQPDKPLAEALRDALSQAHATALRDRLNLPPEGTFTSVLQALILLTKALLYVTLPEARRTTVDERTQALQLAARLKNPAKRARAQRRAERLQDCVLVQAPASWQKGPAGSAADAAHLRQLRRGHWRRGHYRMQAHGQAWSQRKLIFISPTLVGSREAARPADYLVR